MTEIDRIQDEIAKATGEAQELLNDTGETTQALVHVGKAAPVLKREMARRKQLIEKKRQEVKALTEQMQEELDRRMSEALEIIGPLQEMIERLEEGIWTVNLYLGRSEEILTLRKGEPAPADTPIHIRQLVLAMDEESAIDPENNGIDFQEVERFDEWLMEDERHIEQVIPDEKGVVAIRPRNAESKDYGHAWANDEAGKFDEHTYFLIRNGECLYRIWTNFSVGEHMVPPADEFTQLFEERRYNFDTGEYETKVLEPGDFRHDRAEEEVESKQRHYMRMGLVLQGLVDRTAIFHPLPEFGVNFLDSKMHREGKVKFILDAEEGLGTGREPFKQWLRRINSELRPGMRIVGAFEGPIWHKANTFSREGRYRYGHSRLRPSSASAPEGSWEPLTIDGRAGKDLVVKYKRTDTKYSYYGSEPYKRKASVLIGPKDKFIIAIDFAEIETMEEYLRARSDRSEYLYMFPLLKAAIKIKREEAQAEAPFRELIAAQLVTEHGETIESARRTVPGLVEWWKFKNREHRALVGDDEHDRKALTEIVDQYVVRKKLDKTATPAELLKTLQERHRDALVIGRRPDGYHVVLTPENDENVFVRIIVYTKRGVEKEVKRWKMPPRTVLSWRIFYSSARWKAWLRGASLSDYLTDPEKEEIGKSLITEDCIAVTYFARQELFEVWSIDPITVPRHPSVDHDRVERRWGCIDHRWSREQGKPVVKERSGFERTHHYIGNRPWEAEGRSRYGESREVLYTNPEAIAKQEKRYERAEEMEEAGQELSHVFYLASNSVEDQILQDAEKQMFRDFMEEYADETLWEGHRKTLKDPELPEDLSLKFLADLIDRDVDLEGMTVRAAAQAAGVSVDESISHYIISTAEPERDDEEDEEIDDE